MENKVEIRFKVPERLYSLLESFAESNKLRDVSEAGRYLLDIETEKIYNLLFKNKKVN